MKINKVLVDTCFLIELFDDTKPKHQNALDYFEYFTKHQIPCYLSPIVVSEYWQNDAIDSFPSELFRLLSFNYAEGRKAGELNVLLKEIKGSVKDKSLSKEKSSIKDDIKIISHLLTTSDIDCFITKDTSCIKDYITPLKNKIPSLSKKTVIDINDAIEKTLVPQTKLKL